jgi:RNA polymerase sigma-70 factor (ECF subfamily)
MRLARKLTGDRASAEDLFQDTYLKAFRAFDNFNGEFRCRAWLKKIMLNTYINMYHRRRKVVFFQSDMGELSQFPDSESDGLPHMEDVDEDRILRNFVCDEVRDSLLSLPEEYRITVILYDMLNIPYKEISSILSLPVGTVKSRLYRGRRSLRKSIQASHGNGHKNGVCG